MRSLCLLILIAVLVSACAAAGLVVNQRFVSDVDVAQWQSYAWTEPEEQSTDPLVRSTNERIEQEVDARLSAKGYSRTQKGQAEFLVRHAVYAQWEFTEVSKREHRAEIERDLVTGDTTRERSSELGVGPRESGEGVLYIFITELGGQSVWEGSVESPLTYRGEGANKIPAAIRKLFEDFPARGRQR